MNRDLATAGALHHYNFTRLHGRFHRQATPRHQTGTAQTRGLSIGEIRRCAHQRAAVDRVVLLQEAIDLIAEDGLPRGQFVRASSPITMSWMRWCNTCLRRIAHAVAASCTAMRIWAMYAFCPGVRASFLDWQAVMTGFWAHDVSYFLTAAMTIDERRRHERELINHYVAELNRAGGTLDEATAWWEYRRHALYTFCWFPCYPEWLPEEVSANNTERAVAAMVDLDTLACWAQLVRNEGSDSDVQDARMPRSAGRA